MTQIRRVITGHDAQGHATVKIDETSDIVIRDTGYGSNLFWATDGFPVDNDGDEDAANRDVPIALANGSIFRVVEFRPNCQPRRHRTDSIDYAIVIKGEIDMELDNDEVVHLRAGDVLVQRGTIHNWVNKGSESCLIAFVLIDAKPVTVGGQRLEAHG